MLEQISISEKKNILLNSRIICIIRLNDTRHIIELVEAIQSGGITTIEISLNTPNAHKAIKKVREHFKDQVFLGAGTVTTVREAKKAIAADAQFLVTPIISKKVMKYAKRFKTPVCMGAFTPSEIFDAYELGATMVKVFPADILGKKFIQSVKTPLPKIPLLPTGGINAENINEWLGAGATSVGISTAIFTEQDYLNKKFENIREKAKLLAEKITG